MFTIQSIIVNTNHNPNVKQGKQNITSTNSSCGKEELFRCLVLINSENEKIILKAEAECCSYSYFQFENIHQIIGKNITQIINNDVVINCSENDEKDGYLKVYQHQINFSDGTIFPFKLVNNSNGYYYGSLKIEGFVNQERKFTYKPNSIIIIIGLPGSGKTTYARIIKTDNDCIYDDETNLFLIDDKFVNRRNIFVGTKYCDYEIYTNLIKTLNATNPQEAIQTILFESNPQQSIINIKSREGIKDEIEEEEEWTVVRRKNKVDKNKLKLEALKADVEHYRREYDIDEHLRNYFNVLRIPTYCARNDLTKFAGRKK